MPGGPASGMPGGPASMMPGGPALYARRTSLTPTRPDLRIDLAAE